MPLAYVYRTPGVYIERADASRAAAGRGAHRHRGLRRHRRARAARHAGADRVRAPVRARTSAASSARAISPTWFARSSRTAGGAAGSCASAPRDFGVDAGQAAARAPHAIDLATSTATRRCASAPARRAAGATRLALEWSVSGAIVATASRRVDAASTRRWDRQPASLPTSWCASSNRARRRTYRVVAAVDVDAARGCTGCTPIRRGGAPSDRGLPASIRSCRCASRASRTRWRCAAAATSSRSTATCISCRAHPRWIGACCARRATGRACSAAARWHRRRGGRGARRDRLADAAAGAASRSSRTALGTG